MNAIDIILRKLAPGEQPRSEGQVWFYYPRTREVTAKRRFFGSPEVWWVAVNKPASIHCQPVKVEDITTSSSLNLDITLQVQALKDSEPKLIKGLAGAENPELELSRLVSKWVRVFLDRLPSMRDFFQEFDQRLSALQHFLQTQVQEELGLSCVARVRPEKEDMLGRMEIVIPAFPIRFRDFAEKVDVQIEAGLEILQGRRVQALLNLSQEGHIEALLRHEVTVYLERNVSLTDFRKAMVTDHPFWDQIKRHLNLLLAGWGRELGYFHLKPLRFDSDEREHIKFECEVECKIREYPKPITVNNQVLMIPEDYARIKRSGIVKPESYMREKIQGVILNHFIELTFVDVVLRLAEIEKQARERISAIAAEIGYSLKQYFVLPELEPIRLKNGFDFTFPETDFRTRVNNVQVRLQFILSGKIPHLRKIEQFLNGNTNIELLINDRLNQAVSTVIHETQPRQVFLGFYDSLESDTPSIEVQLKEKIQEQLSDLYIEGLHIIIKLIDNNLTNRLTFLMQGTHACTVTVKPLGREFANIPVKFYVRYKVEGIANEQGWETFQKNGYHVGRINDGDLVKNALASFLEERLARVSYEELVSPELQTHKVLTQLAEAATRSVREETGLLIQIRGFTREATEIEKRSSEVETNKIFESFAGEKAITTATYQSLVAKLDVLQKRELKLLEEDPTDSSGELVSIREEIQKIRESTPKVNVELSPEKRQLLNKETTGKATLEEALGFGSFSYNELSEGKSAPEYEEEGPSHE